MVEYSEEINALINDASKLYASKNYELASAKYGEACEKFSEGNDGEEDIELLFLYGKALFQNGVSKSEAFGGAGAGSVEPQEQEQDEPVEDGSNFQFNETLAEEEEDDADAGPAKALEEDEDEEQNSDQDGGDEEEEEEEGEEQTDFELAWDILDLTRSLIENKLEEFKEDQIPKDTPLVGASNDKSSLSPYTVLLEKLSETYDLLGEVSLEAENFKQASQDFAKSLELRQTLYDSKSQAISESHYKLSLAWEFCLEDPESRPNAADHMEKALIIVKSQAEPDEELIKDLETRLVDLKKDPAEELQAEKERIIKGILGEKVEDDQPSGQTSGATSAAAQPAVNDLTNMVVKKKRKSTNKITPGKKVQKQ